MLGCFLLPVFLFLGGGLIAHIAENNTTKEARNLPEAISIALGVEKVKDLRVTLIYKYNPESTDETNVMCVMGPNGKGRWILEPSKAQWVKAK